MTTLVVGVDHRDLSFKVLAVAADLAVKLGADLRVVHAIDLRDYPVDPDSADWEQHAEAALTELRGNVERALSTHEGHWTYAVQVGEPVPTLKTAADEHDAMMIVVGHHKHWTPVRVTRGSVGAGLSRTAHRPVLIVPESPQ
ncbi:universal stress protein [Actinokineospora xionganensis]|uniref:Universal stress protein n=1 Tax=Actinokineospora xionganensis TaxID=2684470 RepID=A0ABR7LAW9_9PSEU|nr:universal stress protein [Actinokineospora xionganensis]MBC6449846.1 universal stress protein [Actinokineospora xionganensis]